MCVCVCENSYTGLLFVCVCIYCSNDLMAVDTPPRDPPQNMDLLFSSPAQLPPHQVHTLTPSHRHYDLSPDIHDRVYQPCLATCAPSSPPTSTISTSSHLHNLPEITPAPLTLCSRYQRGHWDTGGGIEVWGGGHGCNRRADKTRGES